MRLPDGSSTAKVTQAVQGLLDFICLAKYPIHSSQTLEAMDAALESFHENLEVFSELGIHDHFDIPKVHFAGHYRELIEQYRMTDNYNTESTERLHIEFAKDAYAASNRKDKYPQMTLWLEQQEKILHHMKYVGRIKPAFGHMAVMKPAPALIPHRYQQLPKNPTIASVTFLDLETKYGARQFQSALCRFVAQYQNPLHTAQQVAEMALAVHIPFS